MGDIRYTPHYERIRDATHPQTEIRSLGDDEVVAALAAASREHDAYLANVLATEAQNRMQWARAITASLAEGVFAVDKAARATFINAAAERLLGWPREEFLGQDVHDLIHRESLEGHGAMREECPLLVDVLQGGRTIHREDVAYRCKDGRPLPVAYTASPILRDGEVVGAVVVFQDITGRTLAERRRAARLAVTEVLAEAKTVQDLAPRLLKAIGEKLGWQTGDVFVVDQDAELLRWTASWHAQDSDMRTFVEHARRLVAPRGVGLIGRAWALARPVWVRDIAAAPWVLRQRAAVAAGLRGAFSCPILLGQEVLGVFEFYGREPMEEDQDLNEMMLTIGHQIGQFVARRHAEEERLHLARIVESSEDAVVSTDIQGLITSWNRGAERLMGYTAEEAVGKKAVMFTPPDRLPYEREAFKGILQGQPVRNFLAERVRKDGRRISVSVTAFPLKDVYGAVVGAAVIARDITELRHAEEALKESERRFRLLAENARDLIFLYRIHPRRGFEYVSPAAEAITGHAPDAFYADPDLMLKCTHPEDVGTALQALTTEDPTRLVTRAIRKDGREVWTEAWITPVRREDGRVVAIEGIARDITDLKQAEERFRILLESAPDAMVVVDEAGQIVLVNARAEYIFGYQNNELLGRPVETLVPARYRQIHAQHRAAYADNPRTRPMGAGIELKGLRKDGTEFRIDISLAPMNSDSGRWFIAAVRDVREREEAENQGRHMRPAGE